MPDTSRQESDSQPDLVALRDRLTALVQNWRQYADELMLLDAEEGASTLRWSADQLAAVLAQAPPPVSDSE